MDTTATPHLDENLNQLHESVRKFFSESYDTQKNKWKHLDGSFREIEEHLAVVLIYDFLGETDGFDVQHSKPLNSDEDKAKYGSDLMKTALEAAHNKGVNTVSLNNLADDISNHNPNSHGSDIPDEERERIGRKAVLDGLKVVIALLADRALTGSLSSYVQAQFLKLHNILLHSQQLLSPGHTDPEVRNRVRRGFQEVFKGKAHLPAEGDFDYVLILPEHPDEKLIQHLKPLMMIMRWSIVVDYGFENGITYKACRELSDIEISNTALVGQLSEVKTNWLFLNGRQPQTSPRERRQMFKDLSRSILQMKNIIVFDLTHDKGEAEKALLKVWELFNAGPEEEPSDHTTVFSTVLNASGDLAQKLKQSDYQVNMVALDISADDFVSTLVEERWLPSESGSRINLNSLSYLAAGMKFMDTPVDDEKTTIWDSFYSGRTLSVKDMENGCDVYPRGNRQELLKFSDRIKDALSAPDGSVFYLYHQPGAGGTSLARRLAYDFAQKCQNPEVLPVFLTKFDPLSTVEMLSQLSEAAGARITLLVIADDKEINESEFQNIAQSITRKGAHCIFLRIRHILSGDSTQIPRQSFFLASSIRDGNELERFDHKFRNAYSPYLQSKVIDHSLAEIHSVYDKWNAVEMIYYPYTFCERMNKENQDAVFEVPDSFVSNWFSSIKSDELKTLCGYIALAYRFSASKAVDIYSLSSVWRRKDIATLDAYPADDVAAVNKILKVSDEDYIGNGESTLRAPRYAAFAEKILTAWMPAWSTRLSSLAVEFIKSLPTELTDRDHRLLMDLFIQQAAVYGRPDDDKRRNINDRFSPLIGHILDNESLDGAKAVFQALIERYPTDLFYRIHYARLLFEYAHSIEAEPDDANFREAISIIKDVLDRKNDSDSFHHIAGMYWRRIAKARARAALHKNENERTAYIGDITDAADKALRYFDNCNELNRGTSSYGFVSTAELIITALRDIKRLLPPAMHTGMLDEEPYMSYLETLDNTIQHLDRPQFHFELASGDKLDDLRQEYLNLIGDIDKAIDNSRRKFETASDADRKRAYGHRTVTLMIENENKRKKRMSRFELYSNMDKNVRGELSSILKILSDSGDIRSAEQYFHLCRYTRHDQLTDGPTYAALKQWEGLSIEKENQQHRLMASFYLYVCYAVKILNLGSERNRQLEEEHLKYRNICRDLVERLDEEPYTQIAFAGKEHIDTWDSILDPTEAYTVDVRRQRTYTARCRREDALILGMDRNQGDCEINFLKKISFSCKGIVGDAIGSVLRNGVIGFRYRGVGLYDFTTPKNIGIPTASFLPSRQKKAPQSTTEPVAAVRDMSPDKDKDKKASANDLFRTESEKAPRPTLKILGKIELPESQVRKKKSKAGKKERH